MAIARGAGTEIIRNILMEDVNNTNRVLIFGVQHHIYTVLSIICHCDVVNAAGDYIRTYITGYDSLGGTTDERFYIFKQDMQVGQTYVWNDKFSFNGYEPSGTAVMSAAVQILNAAQGGAADAEYQMSQTHATDDFDVIVTYLDQDWT